MMKVLKVFLFFSLLLTTYYLLPYTVYAANEFSSAYDVTYEVNLSGITTVNQNIHLTNLTSNYYASEYTLTIGSEKINKVEAWDGRGVLKVNVEKGTDATKIQVAFNEKVIGQGKTLNWTLRYQTADVAQKLGRIWEINIPRLDQNEQASSYNVTLIVPPQFGKPAYLYPVPASHFYWTLPASSLGITLAFGDWQGFKFALSYHLENPQILPGKAVIALPPDTPYQKILLEKIQPKPLDINVDEDGNWLASYLLLPKQKLEIKVNGYAQVFLSPQFDYPIKIRDKIRENYLKPQNFWEQDEKIRQLANKLQTPEAIYDYVVSALNYDDKRASTETNRLGAKKALESPENAICMEFTDLFIALARAAGIPAREVDGFAYTSNSKLKPLSLVTDILHSWPEYWDEQKNLWIQIDPTWGKTSQLNYFNRFDFNHLAFVIRGISSTYPYPAGSYKSKTGGKDVQVDFVSEIPNIQTGQLTDVFPLARLLFMAFCLPIFFFLIFLVKKIRKRIDN